METKLKKNKSKCIKFIDDDDDDNNDDAVETSDDGVDVKMNCILTISNAWTRSNFQLNGNEYQRNIAETVSN